MGKIIICTLIFILQIIDLQGQAVATEFGKNRIQYHDDFDQWNMYETENFVTYWYGKGREIAHTVVQLAELDNPNIQNILEHKMNDKIELIVYLDLTDMKQTNLGSEEQFSGKGGITKVVENKVFIYFNGNHNDLRKSLRQGIAAVYINAMLHGSNLQEIVQNAILLSLPDWFQDGLVSYVGEPWNAELDNQLKDYFSNPQKKKKDFNRLTKDDALLAGHSMWHFLALTYGEASISNILYLTRIQRSLENGLLYVLGIDSKELALQWQDYYEDKYFAEESQGSPFTHDLPLTSQKRPVEIGRMRLSPDGTQLAYSLIDHGRVRVYRYDLETGDKKVLFRYGLRNYEVETDPTYPAIAWGPDGKELTILYERRDLISLKRYDFEKDEVYTSKLSPEYYRVYDMDYWSPDTLMLSASTDGFSDLYLYAPITRSSVRVTEDFYDDLDATVVYLNQHRYILFSSNRTDENLRKMELDTILPIGQFDLFLLDYDSPPKPSLRQITFSEAANERKARIFGDDALLCLADYSGLWQRIEVSRLLEDPPLAVLHSAYDRDILLHEVVPASPVVIDWLEKEDKPFIHVMHLDSAYGNASVPPKTIGQIIRSALEKPTEIREEEIIDPRYLFQTPFPVPESAVIVEEDQMDTEKVLPDVSKILEPSNSSKLEYDPGKLTPFVRSRVIAARTKFKLDKFNITLDNDILFGGLNSYAGQKREFEPSPLGILFKASIKDLLEDYIITGGARYPTTFNGSEYFLVFDNKKRRIDKQYALYRKAVTEYDQTSPNQLRQIQYVSFLALSQWRYPFDAYNSVRGTITLRNDDQISLATDKPTLDTKTSADQRIGFQLEWVYDNTRYIDINSRTGTRLKAGVELVKKFDLNLFESDQKFQFNKGFMTVLSLDARHYVSLDGKTIFAARVTAATTLGAEHILYNLGGVENWLFPSYDNNMRAASGENYAYTALAANMRGFKYNARVGSSVVLTNAELRVPVFQYLSRQKIRSSFIRNIQLIGFIDAGSAWEGSNPFASGNPLNTVVLYNPPTVEVTVNYYRNPLIVGYGCGVRTLVFGYFLKLDYGWSWETETNRKPLVQFSMGTDF